MEKDTNNFAKGVFVKLPNKNAPDFVLLNVSIKPRELAEWAQQFVTEQSKGWVNLQVLRSKDGGTIYMAVDTYVSKTDMPKEESEAYHNRYQHPDPSVQKANEKSAEQLFNRPLTDEDNKFLADMEF